MPDRPSARGASAFAAGAAIVSVLLLGLLARFDVVDGLDRLWADVVRVFRNPVTESAAHVLDVAGSGWVAVGVVPCVIAIVLLVLRRPWSALVVVLASALSALSVHLLKILYERPRPDDILVEVGSAAYPSGHVTYAATLAALALILVPRWWVAAAGLAWTVLMALGRTVLSAHWLIDTVGGALLGAGVVGVVGVIFADRLHSERRGRAASVGT